MAFAFIASMELRMSSPSIIPNDRLDRDIYLVLEDFRSGSAWRETGFVFTPNSASPATRGTPSALSGTRLRLPQLVHVTVIARVIALEPDAGRATRLITAGSRPGGSRFKLP